ncbi:peptidase inhibitor family I36 protein [Streptomyces netropsis]|uniref:peptidase inhibitor family I36 protein n=1 Tax=Streptomyces netropsis TaxID=55404 RepID=UPI0037BC6B9F
MSLRHTLLAPVLTALLTASCLSPTLTSGHVSYALGWKYCPSGNFCLWKDPYSKGGMGRFPWGATNPGGVDFDNVASSWANNGGWDRGLYADPTTAATKHTSAARPEPAAA